MNRNHTPLRTRQAGAVLVVSLMLLVIMTLIGVTAMRSTIMEEKMAGNTRDSMLAMQAAETALLDAENFAENTIQSLAAAFDGNQPGLYPTGNIPDPFAQATWGAGASLPYSGTYNSVATQPRYIIELIGPVGSAAGGDLTAGDSYDENASAGIPYAFRITARGTGGTDNARSILQSNYVRTF